MFKKILKTLQETGDIVLDKASEVNNVAKDKISDFKEQTVEKALAIIDEWVEILPKLKEMGLELTSFGISMSFSPSMIAELKGSTLDFNDERIKQLMELHPNEKSIKFFLSAVKTTLKLYKKTKAPIQDLLIIRLEVKISPEIKVFVGKPHLA